MHCNAPYRAKYDDAGVDEGFRAIHENNVASKPTDTDPNLNFSSSIAWGAYN